MVVQENITWLILDIATSQAILCCVVTIQTTCMMLGEKLEELMVRLNCLIISMHCFVIALRDVLVY